MFSGVYAGRRVLVTGHTGFKGSWLATWLLQLGAEVAGYANGIPTVPSHVEAIGLERRIRSFDGDVRDRETLAAAIDAFAPEIVFHLAAQALVRRAYAEPAETFETNAIGTLNVLECARTRPGIRAVVLITSDKCYRNVEWPWGYRETDTLGGEDPYSGSKGCAELIAYSYIHSFFATPDRAAVATTRAGNVIGGGDWACDRIVPDCVRAWSQQHPVVIRQPGATRPWQHVLEPLSGYLTLGAHLWHRDERASGRAYNFGPDPTVNQSVEDVIRELGQHWPDFAWHFDPAVAHGKPEARLLKLSCERALAELQWRAVLTFQECIRLTAEWYRAYQAAPAEAGATTAAQIDEYVGFARNRGLAWATA